MLFVLVDRSTGADVEIGRDTGSGLTFELTKDSPVKLYLYTYQSYGTYDVTIYPQIVSVLNPNTTTFTQFAMTNQQLTASASDQKTAINAIISAATGAADFAAFKTAMSAISPVTRSAAPEERSLDVEEPVVVKKTTRKSTKKTEEEE